MYVVLIFLLLRIVMLYKGEVYFKEVFILVFNLMMGGVEGFLIFEFNLEVEFKVVYYVDLVEFYEDVGLNIYEGGDKKYIKFFCKGFLFEWMNCLILEELEKLGIFGYGIYKEWVFVVGFFNV